MSLFDRYASRDTANAEECEELGREIEQAWVQQVIEMAVLAKRFESAASGASADFMNPDAVRCPIREAREMTFETAAVEVRAILKRNSL